MNKETVSYVRHIMGSDFVQLDFLNAVLALAIIAVSLMAFITSRASLFGTSFTLGAILAFFNMIKSFMKKSVLGVLVFACMIIGLAVASLVVFKVIPVS